MMGTQQPYRYRHRVGIILSVGRLFRLTWSLGMLTSELIEHILNTLPQRTIGVLGDLFLDRYLDIDPALNEPSIETGLTAYQVTQVRNYPGAAGTVINNLAALGVGRIATISLIGDDGEGYELRRALAQLAAVELRGIVTTPHRRTPTYTKPMLGREELNRLDIKNRTPTPGAIEDAIIDHLIGVWPQLDALLVVDQVREDDSGVVTQRVRERLTTFAKQDPDKFVLADSRQRIALFQNMCIKPNQAEAEQLRESSPTAAFPAALIDATRHYRAIFATAGATGIHLFYPGMTPPAPRRIPAYSVPGPVDICGAGDSCAAGIACAIVSGASYEQAAAFGNLIASITIQQIGITGTATPEQVRKRWQEVVTHGEATQG
ncbi:MAG: PfkB family carbohydrate kinase [Gemmataceae bacterium]|nr:PfkB family carbohydrate kinase [Gemmata sp.]MDW8199367.1 PfkB family carbohydrate kinase [Gemmataceae bacterium]